MAETLLAVAVLLALLGAPSGQTVPCAEPIDVAPLSKFCGELTKVCVDHGDYVLYGNHHNPRHAEFKGMPQIQLESVHVDYYGFGDVWGTEFLYPQPLLRPATAGEESDDLQNPQFSSWCAARRHRSAPETLGRLHAAPRRVASSRRRLQPRSSRRACSVGAATGKACPGRVWPPRFPRPHEATGHVPQLPARAPHHQRVPPTHNTSFHTTHPLTPQHPCMARHATPMRPHAPPCVSMQPHAARCRW